MTIPKHLPGAGACQATQSRSRCLRETLADHHHPYAGPVLSGNPDERLGADCYFAADLEPAGAVSAAPGSLVSHTCSDGYATEYAKRLASFAQPQPGFLLYFKRFPSRPFPPGVGIDFHLDPIDFPSHRFVIPKAAKKTNRVTRMVFSAQTDERDVLPRFRGKSTGMFRCSLAVWLQTGRDTKLSSCPVHQAAVSDGSGRIIYTIVGLPGTQMWENETDLLTDSSTIWSSFRCLVASVKTPFIPELPTRSVLLFLPIERSACWWVFTTIGQRSSVTWTGDRWHRFRAEVQGNQLMIGQDFTNGAAHTLIYEKGHSRVHHQAAALQQRSVHSDVSKRNRAKVDSDGQSQSGCSHPASDAGGQSSAGDKLHGRCRSWRSWRGAAGGASGGGAPKASAQQRAGAATRPCPQQGRCQDGEDDPACDRKCRAASRKESGSRWQVVSQGDGCAAGGCLSSSGRFDTDAKESTSPRRPLRVPSPKTAQIGRGFGCAQAWKTCTNKRSSGSGC